MEELLLGFLGKTLNLSPEDAAKLLYKAGEDGKLTTTVREDALTSLLTADATRVTKLKEAESSKSKEMFDNGHKKGKKEALTEFEASIKEKYQIEGSYQGADLVAEVAKKAAVSVTDDTIKTHPVFLTLEQRLKAEAENAKVEAAQKVETLTKEYQREKSLITIKNIAAKRLDDLMPIYGDDPKVASARKSDFLSLLDAYDYQEADGKTIVLKGSTRVEDAHGNPTDIDSLVKTLASERFEFKKQTDKGNGGADGGGDDASKRVGVPKSETEYNDALYAAKDSTERLAITAAWEAAQPK